MVNRSPRRLPPIFASEAKQSMAHQGRMDCFVAPLLAMTDRLVAGNVLPDRHAAADGAVEHLGRLLDAVGGGIERGGHRVLRRPGAVRGCGANAAQGLEFLLEAVDAMAGVD